MGGDERHPLIIPTKAPDTSQREPQAHQELPQDTNGNTEDHQEQIHPDLKVEALDHESQATFEQITSGVAQSTVIGAMQDFADGAEDFSSQRLSDAASQLGVEPDVVRGMAEVVRGGFERQAQAAAAEELGGIADTDGLFEWAWQHRQSAMKKAIEQQTMKRSTNGYREIAKDFIANLDTIDPDAILNAEFDPGVSARRHSDGEIVIFKDGNALGSYRNLLRAGWISPRKA